ncbi:MAG: hypothetical protein AAB834_06270, partial [Patescibacteria group bacterium]
MAGVRGLLRECLGTTRALPAVPDFCGSGSRVRLPSRVRRSDREDHPRPAQGIGELQKGIIVTAPASRRDSDGRCER